MEEEPIIGFCDESAFCTAPHRKRAVATRVAKQRIDKGRVTVFGGMLLNGLDVALMSRGSKAPDFVEFLRALRRENPSRSIVLLLDNARIHHAKLTRKECEKLNIKLVHLPPYSPDLNPIEFAWKDGKKELAMLDFEGIKERVKSTLMDIMKERKMRYSRTWMEKFPLCAQMVLK